jgi:hypothetical protein
MKIILKTGEEFQISSAFMQAENQLGISFHGIPSYDTFRAKLTITSVKLIKVYVDDTTYTPYDDFTKVITKTVSELGDGTLEIFVVFEREDPLTIIQEENSQIKNDLLSLENGLFVTMSMVDGLMGGI